MLLLAVIATAAAARTGLPFTPTASLQVTTPQRFSASLGIAFVEMGTLWGPKAGPLVRIEPGLGAGKLHLGGRMALSMAWMDIFYADLTAALMNTWGDTWGGLEKHQTYLGGELRCGTGLLMGTLGVYRHVRGSDEDHPWVVSLGAGLGI